jgi:hypothetical protein
LLSSFLTAHAALTWRADYNTTTSPTETLSNFTGVAFTDSASPSMRTQVFANVDGGVVSSNITVKLLGSGGTTWLVRDRAQSSGTAPSLYTDLLQYNSTSSGITIQFEGLEPNAPCVATFWFYDKSYEIGATQEYYKVTGGGNVLLGSITNVAAVANALYDPNHCLQAAVTADVSGVVSIYFKPNKAIGTKINGWELTALPSATNPILNYASATLTDGDGDGLFEVGESNRVYTTLVNAGITASNVTASIVPQGAAASHFQILNSPNSSFGTINAGGSGSNSTPFLIIATNPAAALGTPYTFSITNITCDQSGTVSSGAIFQITLNQGFSVQGQTADNKFLLAADVNKTDTNSLMVITNGSGMPLVCTLTETASWLSLPGGSSLTVAPHTASNVMLIGNATNLTQGQYSDTLDVVYNQTATNFTSFTVQFDIGPKVTPLTGTGDLVFAGGANRFPGYYEPGEVFQVTVPSINNGAITVTNIAHTLTPAQPAYFNVTAVSNAANYNSMAVGTVTSTTYEVTVLNPPHGTHTFGADNTANGSGPWSGLFTIDVFNQAVPSAPATLTINVPAGGTSTAYLVLTNAGNKSTTFTLSNNGAWPVSYSVQTQTASLVSFNPIFDSPNTNDTFVNWSGNSTVPMNMGFNFPLYGTNYNTFSVSRYGAISFGTTTGANTNTPFALPSGTSPVVAPFWGSTLLATNSIRYTKQYSDKLVVAWGNRTGAEFQTWIYTNGNIRYLYQQTLWGDGAIGVQSGSSSQTIDYTPGNGSETVLLTPQAYPWVIAAPTNGTLNALNSQSVTFTANASGQSTGTTVFTSFVSWGDGTTGAVVVTVNVNSSSPGLQSPPEVEFKGLAGYRASTNMLLVNTGDVALAYTITDVGAQSGGYKWTNTTFNWDNSHWDANSVDAVALLDGDDKTGWLPIGFDFPFYGNVYTQFLIDVNAGVVLSLSQPVVLVPFMGVALDSNAKIRYSGNANQLVVTWENVRLAGGGNDQTFQVILFKDGTIRFQYQTLSGSNAWPTALIGLVDTPRATAATLVYFGTAENPGTAMYTINYVTVTNWQRWDGAITNIPLPDYDIEVITTNGTNVVITYNETVTDQAIVFTPGQPVIITVDPVSGTLPVGGSALVNIYGDARGLTSGTNSATTNTQFNIVYTGGTNAVDVRFRATNSVENVFADSNNNGYSDLNELMFGSAGVVDVIQNPDGSRIISWPKAIDNLSRTYTVWYSTNLMSNWIWLADIPNGTSCTDADHANVPVIYYKVTVQ